MLKAEEKSVKSKSSQKFIPVVHSPPPLPAEFYVKPKVSQKDILKGNNQGNDCIYHSLEYQSGKQVDSSSKTYRPSYKSKTIRRPSRPAKGMSSTKNINDNLHHLKSDIKHIFKRQVTSSHKGIPLVYL